MKKEYPNYLGKMREIENNIKEEDNNVLKEYMDFCLLSSGKEKTEQRKRYALQFLDIAEVPYNNFNREIIEHIYKLIKDTDREICGKNEVIKQLKFFIKWKFDVEKDSKILKNINVIPQRKGYNTSKLNPSSLVTKEEINKLITAAGKDWKKVSMVSLQTELGLRPQELLNLKWGDIKIVEGIGEAKIFSSKTKDTRVLPFKVSVNPLIKWKNVYPFPDIKNNDFIFPSLYSRKKPLYRTYLSQLYRKLSREAGIRLIYPYLARHTKMSEVNKKCPSKIAAAYGGHGEKTAFMYTHLSEADIKEVILKQMYDIKESVGSPKLIKQFKELKEYVLGIEKRLKKDFKKLDNNYLALIKK